MSALSSPIALETRGRHDPPSSCACSRVLMDAKALGRRRAIGQLQSPLPARCALREAPTLAMVTTRNAITIHFAEGDSSTAWPPIDGEEALLQDSVKVEMAADACAGLSARAGDSRLGGPGFKVERAFNPEPRYGAANNWATYASRAEAKSGLRGRR